jgi:hypothetical protein
MPKRENISLAIFTLIEPNWVDGLGAGGKNRFLPLILIVFGFSPHIECAVNKKKIWS